MSLKSCLTVMRVSSLSTWIHASHPSDNSLGKLFKTPAARPSHYILLLFFFSPSTQWSRITPPVLSFALFVLHLQFIMFSTSKIGLAAVLLATLNHAQNCVMTIPPNPLTAAGLATLYKMTGCNQIDFSNNGSFVEATILDPATGTLQVYNPLGINQDQAVDGKDFITPVTPTLPANAVVGIWFGSNAVTVTLAGDTNGCINGNGGSIC
jgi:hypothetical protein